MLLERIDTDLKAAMKEKNTLRLETLRMLKAAIKNKEIEKKVKALNDEEIVEAIQKQIKQRRDSIAEFQKANRKDLIDKETREIQILELYLPQQLSEAELKGLIQEAIKATGATSKQDVGRIMKEVMPKIKGRADGKQINQVALSLLGG